ncbi:sex determination protein fruitless-like isoform X4 [Neocloeon triangulifer]|uniref:sex determination protein fruitless-like isoform X4 n=1 Tax=Neocloeon triangulifer TaxID=2078957 RepID=UPI00286F6AF9|nr:sex determination protein fruitless-like isoform X4 [Neocloeon triangulifer]
MASQQYSLRWNNYVRHMTSAFESLRSDRDLIDVTLSCEGKKIPAHKMLLSACSSYFKDLFKENPCQHPVIIFRNVTFDDLMALVDFMYNGEVNVEQEQLASFLNTAELLQVQGLTNSSKDQEKVKKTAKEDERVPASGSHFEEDVEERTSTPTRSGPPAAKKRKWQSPNRTESPAAVLESQTAQGSADGDEDVQSIEQVPLKTETPDYDEDEDIQAGSGVDDTADEQDIVQKLQKSDQLVLTSNRNRTSNNEHSLFGNNSVDMDSGDMSSFGMAGPSNESMGQEGMQVSHESEEETLGEFVLVSQLNADRKVYSEAKMSLRDGRYFCGYCKKHYSDRSKCRTHIDSHLGKATCFICQKTLSNLVNLKPHLLTHIQKMRCKICGQFFAYWGLKKHAKAEHNADPKDIEQFLDNQSVQIVRNISAFNEPDGDLKLGREFEEINRLYNF